MDPRRIKGLAPSLAPALASPLWADVKTSDPDYLLALPYLAPDHRAGALSLIALTAALRGVPARVSDPMLGAIRLQWWREAIGEVFGAGAPRRHPLVLALAASVGNRPDLRPAIDEMIDRTADFLAPDHITDTRSALRCFDVHEGARLALLAAFLLPGQALTSDGAQAPWRQLGAYYGLGAAAQMDAPPSAEPEQGPEQGPGQGIEGPAARFARTPSRTDIREALAPQAEAAWRTLAPFDPAIAPVAGVLKWAPAYMRGRGPGPLAKRLSMLLTVLRGR